MWKRTQKSGRALTISPRATPPSLADYGRSWWTKIMIMIMRSWSQNESVAFTVCVSSLMIIMMWGSNWEAGCTTEKEMVSWWTNKWSQNWQLSWPGPSFTQLIHSNIEMHNVCLQKTPGSKWTLCEICVFRGLHSEKLFWGRKPEKAWVASRRVVPPPNTKKIYWERNPLEM